MSMSREEAVVKLAELTSQIRSSIREAEAFAIEHKLDFSLDIAYGMGGYFDGDEGEWNPSSQSC